MKTHLISRLHPTPEHSRGMNLFKALVSSNVIPEAPIYVVGLRMIYASDIARCGGDRQSIDRGRMRTSRRRESIYRRECAHAKISQHFDMSHMFVAMAMDRSRAGLLC